MIHYTYDALYRLTEAAHTGDIAANYDYVYDPVGNMLAYTATVGSNTRIVTQTFNTANQLHRQYSNAIVGEHEFVYDDNGNLVQTFAPGMVTSSTSYAYDQRNLLTYVAFSNPICIGGFAAYGYDGRGDRVWQQWRETSCSFAPTETITYTNDTLGLTQALLADDGIAQTAQLYGLDLISQDDGVGMRTLLTDGLGSVRQELDGGAVETTTTYGPYGKLVAQSGTSGTVYGYTGEQEDAATGLVYLRARYYNPNTNHFLTRDPFPGYANLPQSQNGYSYVHGNPISHADPLGLCIEGWPGGSVRMNQYPYGTSGICPNTLGKAGWIIEGNAAMDEYYRSLPGPLVRPEADGISIFGSIPSDVVLQRGPVSVGPTLALEVLYNFHNADTTLFVVLGTNIKISSGTVFDDGAISLVYNIGDDNLQYSGDFHAINGSISGLKGLGLTGGHAWSPEDFGIYNEAYSKSLMLSCGKGASIQYNETEYLPVITVKGNGEIKYELYDYLWFTGEGQISSKFHQLREALEYAVDTYNK